MSKALRLVFLALVLLLLNNCVAAKYLAECAGREHKLGCQ